MDALTKRGASETMALKLASGFSQPKRRAEFDRAMKELQGKFLALKVEERYEPFTYVWDTLEHRWPDALKESRALSRSEAAYLILRRYFEIAGFGNERALARILQIEVGRWSMAPRGGWSARKSSLEQFASKACRASIQCFAL